MQERRTGPLIFILILAGFILKLLWIGKHDLAHDEPFTVLQAHRSLSGLFKILPEENNPPLYFMFIHFWVKLVPLDEGWLRIPSAIFSALTVWPLFLIGRSLQGTRTAVVASLFYFFSNYHLGFAHEVRAYSLFALLATTSMWQLIRCANGKSWIWWVVVNALMVYTHFFGWLLIGTQFLCILLLKDFRRLIIPFTRSLLLVVLTYLPYGQIFLRRFGTSVSDGTWLTPPVPEEIYNMIWRWSNVPVAAVLFLSVILVHVIRSKWRDPLTRLGSAWAFIPLLCMFAASFFVPMFLDRYLIYAAPGFHLLGASAAMGLAMPARWRMIVPATLLAIMAISFRPWRTDAPTPSAVIEQAYSMRQDQKVPILIHPWWYLHTFAWHTNRNTFKEPDRLQDHMARSNVHPMADPQEMEAFLEQHGRVILVVAGAEENRQLDQLLADRSFHILSTAVPDRHVRVMELSR